MKISLIAQAPIEMNPGGIYENITRKAISFGLELSSLTASGKTDLTIL